MGSSFPIHCSGRHYPNAPPQAKRDTVGRGPPAVFQLKFSNGNAQWADYEDQWLNLQWQGHDTTGWGARGNWSWWTTDPTVFQCRLDSGGFGIGFRRSIFFHGELGVEECQTRFVPPFAAWDEWPPSAEVTYEYHSHLGSQKMIDDMTFILRVGTYARLPANFCILP